MGWFRVFRGVSYTRALSWKLVPGLVPMWLCIAGSILEVLLFLLYKTA